MAEPDEYLLPPPEPALALRTSPDPEPATKTTDEPAKSTHDLQLILDYLASKGFAFEPWQVAGYITAVRTKPFVILAGISGTGKTKLPRLVSEATGAKHILVPVRPNWSDSSDLLGYERLDRTFKAGPLLQFARQAQSDPTTQYFFVLDELNIARVEYYLAEVLSHIEERQLREDGSVRSQPLLPDVQHPGDATDWENVCLPGNLCIVGSVNMDETTFGFSRKVLDRAFVIEFSKVNLATIQSASKAPPAFPWPITAWRPSAPSLASHPERTSPDVAGIIDVLIQVNEILAQGQMQFGYRTRDEIIVYCLEARQAADFFATSDSGPMDPLDLAISMKVLPRIQGGSVAVRQVLQQLAAWASPDTPKPADTTPSAHIRSFPTCSSRIKQMLKRLDEQGFTSYWL